MANKTEKTSETAVLPRTELQRETVVLPGAGSQPESSQPPERLTGAEATAEARPRKRPRGLVLAASIGGGVLVAGALFGGGVTVGAHLPGSTQSQFERPGMPGDGTGFSGAGQGGPGGGMPGTGTDTGTDTESN